MNDKYKELSHTARVLIDTVIRATMPEDTSIASAVLYDLVEYIAELEKVNKLRDFFGYHGDIEKEFDAQKKYIKDLETAIENGKNINISSIDDFTNWWIDLHQKIYAWHSRTGDWIGK